MASFNRRAAFWYEFSCRLQKCVMQEPKEQGVSSKPEMLHHPTKQEPKPCLRTCQVCLLAVQHAGGQEGSSLLAAHHQAGGQIKTHASAAMKLMLCTLRQRYLYRLLASTASKQCSMLHP